MFKSKDGLPSLAAFDEYHLVKEISVCRVDWWDAMIWSIDNYVDVKSCITDKEKLKTTNIQRRKWGLPIFFVVDRKGVN